MALFEQEKQHVPSRLLRDRYSWPPFSILNTQMWEWKHRVDDWDPLIGNSSDGRDKRYCSLPTHMFSPNGTQKPIGTSRFDPYLTELMLRWFSRPGDKVLDPFAGGNVRGVVSAVLGRHYIGIDLSEMQVEANRNHYDALCNSYTDLQGTAEWICGDSIEIDNNFNADFIITCPPYYNLESYTKDPRDLSRQKTYDLFLLKYGEILFRTTQCLKDNSFLVIVVSEIRKELIGVKNSQYLGFVPDTIKILQEKCSLHYYNELILINSVGSLPMRAPSHFDRTRKVGRYHQNVLVFYKGDITKIEDKFKNVSVM